MTYDRRAQDETKVLRSNVERDLDTLQDLHDKIYSVTQRLRNNWSQLGEADEDVMDHEDYDKARKKIESLLGPTGYPQINMTRLAIRQVLKDRPAKR